MLTPTTPVESYSAVTYPALILAVKASKFVTSIVVIDAEVPTISVTATPVMFIFLASNVSTSRVVIVA